MKALTSLPIAMRPHAHNAHPLSRRLFIAFVLVMLLIGGSWLWQLTSATATDEARLSGVLLSDGAANPEFTEWIIKSLQERLHQRPNDARAYASLGAAYLQKARESGDPTFYAKAESVLQKALALSSDDVEALTSLGTLALARHQFRVGLAYGQKARALNPFSARALGVIADAQIELGQYAEALETIQQMVDTRPDMSSYARVSYARELNGDPLGALAAMRLAAEAGSSAPENVAWAQTHVALLLFNRGDLDGAEREYRAAMNALPSYGPAKAGLARVLAARGDAKNAIALYEPLVKTLPLSEYVIALGDVYIQVGREREAEQQYALARVIAQLQRANGVDTDLEMALFEADQAKPSDDLTALIAQAQRIYRDRPTIYGADMLAWTLYQAGQYAEAQRWSEQALKLNTQDALLWFHAGMIAAKLGERVEAIRKLEHALAINPYFSLRWAPTAQQTLQALR